MPVELQWGSSSIQTNTKCRWSFKPLVLFKKWKILIWHPAIVLPAVLAVEWRWQYHYSSLQWHPSPPSASTPLHGTLPSQQCGHISNHPPPLLLIGPLPLPPLLSSLWSIWRSSPWGGVTGCRKRSWRGSVLGRGGWHRPASRREMGAWKRREGHGSEIIICFSVKFSDIFIYNCITNRNQ